ncbi:SsrA-binding protein SmpB [Candidatus Berkelbacteria bacterium]|nr:SsrA-binding protein SmpB [Candidatus Berkelbacteria bacterium]
MKAIAVNKQAFFNYQIQENWEAGIVLTGLEIKAIRAGRVNINGSYVRPFQDNNGNSELWWVGSHFNTVEGDQTRTKKILLKGKEIERIIGKLSAGEFTIVPLELYLKRGLAKLKIGLGSRKQKHDKREILRKRDQDRDISQNVFRRR